MSDVPQSTVCFDDLVREHQAGFRAYIRALGVQEAWVDDLAQEAFLIAYRRLDEFEPSADFGCWLRGIARNLVANERRKNARRSRLLHDSLADVLRDDTDRTGRAASTTAHILQALNDCVAQLPARSRELLERRYADNADANALAAVFKSSATAVRQTLVRTRAAVRRCLSSKLGEAWL